MGNCAQKIEIAEYVKMCGITDIDISNNIDLLSNAYYLEEQNEEGERNYFDIHEEIEPDDDIEENLEIWEDEIGYCNVFDELMEEHPEWFPELKRVSSEWDIIVMEYKQPWKKNHRNRDEECFQKW